MKFTSYSLVCQDYGRDYQISYDVLGGVPSKTDIRARMVQLEYQAMSCILGIFYIRKNHSTLDFTVDCGQQ